MQLHNLVSTSTETTPESVIRRHAMPRAKDQWRNIMKGGGQAFPFIWGCLMSINFLILWAIPIAGMGLTWKWVFRPVFGPVYSWMDSSRLLRSFAENFVYTNPKHADFFAISILLVLNFTVGVGTLFYVQLTTGNLPYWLIAVYYCSWVGTGGRIMGAAYALAHKEVRRIITAVRQFLQHFLTVLPHLFYLPLLHRAITMACTSVGSAIMLATFLKTGLASSMAMFHGTFQPPTCASTTR